MNLAEDIKEEPSEYARFFARGLMAERRGNLEEAIENYLRSIELKSDYNPSYFRFNALIRKVENPEVFRKRMTDIVWKRFSIPPSVIVENSDDKYVFLVEKMSQYLLIYKGKVLENLYPVTTGQDWEDKWVEGDKRTPEGIYYFTEFIPPERLPKMYGGIAVVLNYPNPVDKLLGKGGSGIWLHGSDEEDRNNIPFSTRGCVVAGNDDLRSIVKRIAKENTLIAIYKEIPTDIEVDDVVAFLSLWERSWEEKDVDTFLSMYSKRFRWKRGRFRSWERYKRRVILGKRSIDVEIKDLTVVAFRRGLSEEVEYYVAEFTQVYRSDTYSDVGFKRLYIIKENDELKILTEEFKRDRRL
jgi:murein L,D-transpeptidase YafK